MPDLTLQIVEIIDGPIPDDDLNDALRPHYEGCVLASGHEANGLILRVGTAPVVLGYRNVDGPWGPSNRVGQNGRQSDRFLGVVSSQVKTFLLALPQRLRATEQFVVIEVC